MKKFLSIISTISFLAGCSALPKNGQAVHYDARTTYYVYNVKKDQIYPDSRARGGTTFNITAYYTKDQTEKLFKFKHVFFGVGSWPGSSTPSNLIILRTDAELVQLTERVNLVNQWFSKSYEDQLSSKDQLNKYLADNGISSVYNEMNKKENKSPIQWYVGHEPATKEAFIFWRADPWFPAPITAVALNQKQFSSLYLESTIYYERMKKFTFPSP